MKTLRIFSLATVIVASSMLTACWDDNEDTTTASGNASVPVPDSAAASSASFISFLTSLALGDETSEPYTIPDSFAPPADESDGVIPLG